ncbi:hypothetical protein K2173_003282 [Erythroxylum novogranatense]|uniref:REF/SRPP-like protein n=1 Tax=Erythroxylum novogranatense TaxID=1862640 RepID=A0AAV8SYQ0_9ROSI|nr:hypothetical protein K2173_003282 [Erythroxylum novogranatense]
MEKKEIEHENRELKHLGFVRSVAIHSLVFICNFYESAKQNLGPLRSTIGSIENAVSTLVGPFYEKFKDVPGNVLEFLDEKVDEAKDKFDKDAPSGVKQVVSHAETLIQKAAKKGQELIQEARSGGLPAALHYAAEESKHLVLDGSVKIWTKLNEYPILHSAAEIAVPTAAHWSEKYNHVLKYMTQKGYPVVGCLPLVPIDEIA